jgi:hypothetical protein
MTLATAAAKKGRTLGQRRRDLAPGAETTEVLLVNRLPSNSSNTADMMTAMGTTSTVEATKTNMVDNTMTRAINRTTLLLLKVAGHRRAADEVAILHEGAAQVQAQEEAAVEIWAPLDLGHTRQAQIPLVGLCAHSAYCDQV